MKKTILLATLATISLAAIAQKKETVNPVPATIEKTAKTNNTDTVVVTKAKFIKIGEKLFSVADLGNPGTVALVVPIEWIVENYQYLDNSNGGYSKKQLEELQKPLAGWYRYYVDMLQQQRQQAQKKQE